MRWTVSQKAYDHAMTIIMSMENQGRHAEAVNQALAALGIPRPSDPTEITHLIVDPNLTDELTVRWFE